MGKHPAPKRPNSTKFHQHLYWMYQPDKAQAERIVVMLDGRRYKIQLDGSLRRE
jgi:hypothetical protein